MKTLAALCVATYKRPAMLQRCFAGMARLHRPNGVDLCIVLVDNDAAGSAETIAQEFQNTYPLPLHYHVEPRRGICYARNALLEQALYYKAEWIAMLDDDSCPVPGWFAALYAGAMRYRTDIVTGPNVQVTTLQHSDTETILPARRKKKANGTTPRHVFTGNLMFRNTLIREHGLRFDLFYNQTGGGDIDFSQRAYACGYRAAWINEAIVVEYLPAERRTLRYRLYRDFSVAATNVHHHKRRRGILSAWCKYPLQSLGKYACGLIALPIHLLTRQPERTAKALDKLAAGTGYLAGLIGARPQRYR